MNNIDFAELPSLENQNEITSICIDPKGEFMLIADMKGYISMFSFITKKLEGKYGISAHGKDLKIGSYFGFLPLSGLTISPDGKLAAVATFDGVVHLWDIHAKKQIKSFVTEEALKRGVISAERVYNIMFVSDGKRLVFGGQVKLQMWDIETGQFIHRFEKGYGFDLACCPSKNLFATRAYDELIIYDLAKKKPTITKTFPFQTKGTAFSSIGTFLAIIVGDYQDDGKIQLFSTNDWKCLKTFQLTGVALRDLTISPDEQLIVAISVGGFRIWDIKSGMYLYHLAFPPAVGSGVNTPHQSAIFSPMNKRHFYYPIGNQVYVWRIQTAPNPLIKRPFYHNASDFSKEITKTQSKVYNTKSVTLVDDQLKAEVNITDRSAKLEITRNGELYFEYPFKTKGNKNFAGETLGLLLSPNKRFLVFFLYGHIWL